MEAFSPGDTIRVELDLRDESGVSTEGRERDRRRRSRAPLPLARQHHDKGLTTLIALARLDVEQAELAIAQRRLELDVEERQELLGRLEVLEETLEENRRGEQNRYGGF
jgi:transcription initiation factor TFIIIB Brf1 subunit/transcription initiation factor TFIIB